MRSKINRFFALLPPSADCRRGMQAIAQDGARGYSVPVLCPSLVSPVLFLLEIIHYHKLRHKKALAAREVSEH